MNDLTDKYLKIAVSRDYLAPNSLDSDPLDQKLLTCWQSLASMASSNQVVDDGSCQEASGEIQQSPRESLSGQIRSPQPTTNLGRSWSDVLTARRLVCGRFMPIANHRPLA